MLFKSDLNLMKNLTKFFVGKCFWIIVHVFRGNDYRTKKRIFYWVGSKLSSGDLPTRDLPTGFDILPIFYTKGKTADSQSVVSLSQVSVTI